MVWDYTGSNDGEREEGHPGRGREFGTSKGVSEPSRCWELGESEIWGRPLSDQTASAVGVEGERLATRFLLDRDYEIIERNWRCGAGEVDIIAEDGDDEERTVVLIEVKTRLSLGADCDEMPELAVDRAKREKYRELALVYLSRHPEYHSVRFDVVAINIVAERTARLRHLVGAYDGEEF